MTSHKMGSVLCMKMRGRIFQNQVDSLFLNWLGQDIRPPPHRPFRVVRVLRNFYDALVSGYLYHKQGNECGAELKWHGGQHFPLFVLKDGFAQEIDTQHLPPPQGRTICEYLAQESERDGMRVWMEWIYFRDYGKLWEIDQLYRQSESAGNGRMMRLCMEDFGEGRNVSLTQQVHQFLTPYLPAPSGEVLFIAGPGTHGTHTAEAEKSRLLQIVREHDAQYFGGRIARESDYFGCGRREETAAQSS